MRSSSRSAALASLLLFVAAAPARAGSEDDSRSLFARGRTLRGEGKCEQAIVEFRRALELQPKGLGSLRNIAECEEQLGRLASARRSWFDLRRAVLQSTEVTPEGRRKYEGWDRDAETAYHRLASRVARLTVRLTGARLERVSVSIDGAPLDPRLHGVALERDLGTYTVTATYGGAAPLRESVTLREGENRVLELRIPAPAGGEDTVRADAGAPAGAGARSAGGGGTSPTAAYVALGAGGLAAIGAGVAVAVRAGALSEIEEACPALTGCSPDLRDARDRGELATTLANVLAGAAVLGGGVGLVLLMTAAPEERPPGDARGARLAAGVAPLAGGGAAAFARVRFW